MKLSEMLKDELPQGRFWTDAWSLVEGCTPLSPGCANCWLAGMEHRFGRHKDRDCLVDAKGRFTGMIRVHEERLEAPLRARKPRVYAVWSDLFHEDVPEEFRDRAFNRMSASKGHHFMIVTKRPHEAVPFLRRHIGRSDRHFGFQKWPLPNVTILVTMEDQQRFEDRLPHAIDLAQMGWNVGILAEPLLSAINASSIVEGTWLKWFKWIITGGESGLGARPVYPDWVRSLRDQSQAAGVPFMFKQWGEWAPSDGVKQSLPFRRWREFPKGSAESRPIQMHGMVAEEPVVLVGRIGKKLAGRTLDGREWLEVPHG